MKAYIIHGWEGYPEEGWFPWLKSELEKKGFSVEVPTMPNTEAPEIKAWVNKIKEIAKPDERIWFIGHSIGCQAILRYLESLDEEIKIKGCIFVAGWITLTQEATLGEEEKEIAEQWLTLPINFDKIKKHTNNFTAIFSDNDPYVPLANLKIFEEKLNAKIIMEHEKGHFSGEDNVTELPSVLNAILNSA